MRNYPPHYAKYGIPKARYNELRAYCLQYPLWKAEAQSLLGVGAQQYSAMPHGSGVGNPVVKAAERREHLLRKIEQVESVARMVDGGRWYAALIQNCCMGKSLAFIDPAVLPSSNRNAFFVARRSFYLALDGCKHEI
ncbi:MAG: hypothetical protein IJ523_06765 [Succinivibrionaceae bacterium]|nr:hypothetical protein [Succinivibrionaceae bacterium]